MTWMTPDLIQSAKDNADMTREGLANLLGVTGYKVRQLRRAIDNESNGPTTCVFDLETTDLKGDFGRLLCGSVLSCPSMEMRTFRIDEFVENNGCSLYDDGLLAVAIRDFVEQHDVSVGYFSKGFDIPFLNTRLMANGERKMKTMQHADPIWGYKGWRGVKLRSSSMKVVADWLDIERKQDVPIEVWVAARTGDKAALDLIVDRCESDVRITLDIYLHNLRNGLTKNLISPYP